MLEPGPGIYHPSVKSSLLALMAIGCLHAQDYDLLLKGGHVVDGKNKLSAVRDVAIKDGKIAEVAANIPAAKALKVVDASGLYVLSLIHI